MALPKERIVAGTRKEKKEINSGHINTSLMGGMGKGGA